MEEITFVDVLTHYQMKLKEASDEVETIKNQLHNTINSLDNSNELQIIYAKAKYIEDLKEEFIEKLDEEIKKIELNNIKESSSDEKISNIIKRKNIKENLFVSINNCIFVADML